MIGIGIDTGGTYTDAVVYDLKSKKILGAGKSLTTKSDLEIGIANALDTLPEDLLAQAETVSLSTTLATNACVENKGGRAKLLVIGIPENLIAYLQDVFASYGMQDLSNLIILDARAENIFSNPYDPDWENLRGHAAEYFGECDCVGIVQMNPKANGGRFELKALEILKKELTIPLTIASDFSNETDILKTCASTLLNARLIPLIHDFMDAVHHVLEKRGIHVPFTIVRSDGSLMSEEMARTAPVETLLCGPAASVLGGCELTGEENALIIDMGGTTTDIAIMTQGEPVRAKDGIYIGQWKTMIKGLDVNAVALGGDSAVRYQNEKLYLDSERVIPISVLASQYENVLPSLKHLNQEPHPHTRWIHEFYVFQKDISDKSGYTEYEQRACQVLKEKPLITREFVQAIDGDLYQLGMERLLSEGVIIKSGLTPTDIMILKGDFAGYDGAAAKEMLQFISINVYEKANQIPDAVYDLVLLKLYTSIGRRILKMEYPSVKEFTDIKTADSFLQTFYHQAREKKDFRLANLRLTTSYSLIGVGAPIHVFLPKVAELLGTRACIPSYAHVANALGAISGSKTVSAEVFIKIEYNAGVCLGHALVADCKHYVFKKKEDAIALGKQEAQRLILKKAAQQGMSSELPVEYLIEEKRLGGTARGYLTDIIIHAHMKE